MAAERHPALRHAGFCLLGGLVALFWLPFLIKDGYHWSHYGPIILGCWPLFWTLVELFNKKEGSRFHIFLATALLSLLLISLVGWATDPDRAWEDLSSFVVIGALVVLGLREQSARRRIERSIRRAVQASP